MATLFKFETALQDHGYRMEDWRRSALPPVDGLKGKGVFVCAYLTGTSGRRYHGQRGFDDVRVGESLAMSFCTLRDGDRHHLPDELWASPRMDQLHALRYEEYADRLLYSTEHAQVEIVSDGWRWKDGGGRWNLNMKPLGDRGYFFFIPKQEEIPICQYHVGQNYLAEGEVEGEVVKGCGYLERSWGPRDTEFQFFDLPLIRRMNKAWMYWYASFADGGYSTGCARKGRLGVNWSMAYVVNDGVAELITPTMTDIAYTKDGLVRHVRLNTGKQVIEIEQDCASYFPFHTIGRVESVTGRGAVVDSWTDVEWWPDNADVVLKHVTSHSSPAKGLFTQLAEIPIVGEKMIIPGVTE